MMNHSNVELILYGCSRSVVSCTCVDIALVTVGITVPSLLTAAADLAWQLSFQFFIVCWPLIWLFQATDRPPTSAIKFLKFYKRAE